MSSHALSMHVLVPIWARVPARLRWSIVGLLNRSNRFAWCDLVDAALTPTDGTDACDGHIPRADSEHCRTRCGWLHDHTDHSACTCYCGKFRGLTIGREG